MLEKKYTIMQIEMHRVIFLKNLNKERYYGKKEKIKM